MEFARTATRPMMASMRLGCSREATFWPAESLFRSSDTTERVPGPTLSAGMSACSSETRRRKEWSERYSLRSAVLTGSAQGGHGHHAHVNLIDSEKIWEVPERKSISLHRTTTLDAA